MKHITIIYVTILVVMSFFSVILTVYDKLAAKARKQRISESTLLLCGFFGGATAMFITMQLIRHKTRHLKFMLFLPIVSVLHIALFIFLYLNIT